MRNLLIVLLTAVIVAACAFLPGFLLERAPDPELELNGTQVSVSSESSSGYAWRMSRIAAPQFGGGSQIFETYIPQSYDEETEELKERFLKELAELCAAGALPEGLLEYSELRENAIINYFYVVDTDAFRGFRIAVFQADSERISITMTMDIESGKLAIVEYGGRALTAMGAMPVQSTSWYDVLRSYADYLGLSSGAISVPPQESGEKEEGPWRYYDEITADRLAVPTASGEDAWLELRVLRDTYYVTLAVYRGES